MANGNGSTNKGLLGGSAGAIGVGSAVFTSGPWLNVTAPAFTNVLTPDGVLALDFFLKLSVTGVAYVISALFTILVNDWLLHRLKQQIFKNKNKDNGRDKMESEDEERVA